MAINMKSFSEMVEKDVFTHKGAYSGRISDIHIDLNKFRVNSIVVDTVKGSFLADMVGNRKGVVVPFQMIESIGDVVIIKHVSAVSDSSDEVLEDAMEDMPTVEE